MKLRSRKKLKPICITSALVVALSALAFSANISALPVLDKVTQGDIHIPEPRCGTQKMVIQQESNKAIVDWSTFNIRVEEGVHFNQPVNGVCLNRINGANGMSQIDGFLSATGRILLINNAGVMMSDTAVVNVGGIIASAVDVTDQSFLGDGPLYFDGKPDVQGAIINHGLIVARDKGIVALLGNGVVNTGAILANYGKVILKSGASFVVDFNGDGVINYAVDFEKPGVSSKPALDENGTPLTNAITQTGFIDNAGGEVILQASAASDIFDNMINMSGVIQAKGVVNSDGGVTLIAEGDATVNVTGVIDVTAADADARNGTILIAGNKIDVAENSIVTNDTPDAGGLLVLTDASGMVKSYDLDKRTAGDAHTHTANDNLLSWFIGTGTAARELRRFYDYKRDAISFLPEALDIKFDKDPEIEKYNVSIDMLFNEINLSLRSITEQDFSLVQDFLNSQPLVRQKYGSGKTMEAEATKARVKVLADRFDFDLADGCFMHGGFIITDKDTNEFLGMINSGTSNDVGKTEMACMIRPDAWSHKPDNLTTDYLIPADKFLSKDYEGVATAAVNALMEYTSALYLASVPIKGNPVTAMRAVVRTDNPGGWKALVKNGFELTKLTKVEEYGDNLRYQLEYKY